MNVKDSIRIVNAQDQGKNRDKKSKEILK